MLSDEHSVKHLHARMDDILSRPEFYGLEPSLFQRIAQWWNGLITQIETWVNAHLSDVGRLFFSDTGIVLIGVFAVLALGWVLYYVVRTAKRGWVRESRVQREMYGDGPTRDLTPALLLQWAKEARAQGDFREAIRFLYQASLAHLNAEGVVVLKPHATNWEYLRQASALPEASYQPFSQLTRLFERIWYGEEVAFNEDFEAGHALLSSVLN